MKPRKELIRSLGKRLYSAKFAPNKQKARAEARQAIWEAYSSGRIRLDDYNKLLHR